jgi:hypothetical protein
MQYVFNDINDNVTLVKNGIGQTYIPMLEINQKDAWNFNHGYQVYMNQLDTLVVTGVVADPFSNPFGFPAGWNMVSYLRSSSMYAPKALETIVNDESLILAKNGAGHTNIPMFEVNQIGNMQPGQSYRAHQ